MPPINKIAYAILLLLLLGKLDLVKTANTAIREPAIIRPILNK